MDIHIAPMFFLVSTVPQILVGLPDSNCSYTQFTVLATVTGAIVIAQFISTYARLHSVANAFFHSCLLVMVAASFLAVAPSGNCFPEHVCTIINILGTATFFLLVLINNRSSAYTRPSDEKHGRTTRPPTQGPSPSSAIAASCSSNTQPSVSASVVQHKTNVDKAAADKAPPITPNGDNDDDDDDENDTDKSKKFPLY